MMWYRTINTPILLNVFNETNLLWSFMFVCVNLLQLSLKNQVINKTKCIHAVVNTLPKLFCTIVYWRNDHRFTLCSQVSALLFHYSKEMFHIFPRPLTPTTPPPLPTPPHQALIVLIFPLAPSRQSQLSSVRVHCWNKPLLMLSDG